MEPLQILYQDENLIAINKPHGLLVHQSSIAADAEHFALQLLRDQIGQRVYPAHRIDRKTAGVLLFTLDEPTNSLMQQQFMLQEVKKTYHAIVRGYTIENEIIDYALTNDRGKKQDAITSYRRMQTAELDVPFGSFSTSRYSLVEIIPKTGRMHQIRKHFGHIFHPIIGDRKYGCNKQNRLFLEKWNHREMLLHAISISFAHPLSGKEIYIEAPYQSPFKRMMDLMGW
ncbi:MAG: pseudouridine synthase [Ignavibacteria bacterium]|nr:pseudouridine synthase [Ignavibacteria bacterium]